MLSEFFEIDSEVLKVKSNKPKHLLKRKLTHSCTPTVNSAASVSTRIKAKAKARRIFNPINNSQNVRIKLQEKMEKAERKRSMCLEMKRLKVANRLQKIKDLVMMNEESQYKKRLEIIKEISTRERNYERRRTKSETSTADEQSALKIQSWYRLKKLLPLSRLHHKIGLTSTLAQSLSFNALTSRLQNPVLVKSATFTITRAKRITGTKTTFKSPGKVLLSAYMLASHASESLDLSSPSQVALLSLAKTLVSNHDHFITISNPDYITESAHLFMTSFKSYYNSFEAFKNADRLKIVNELVNEFIGLDKLYLSVMNNPGEFLESIKNQQSLIKKRIEKFNGLETLYKTRKEFMNEIKDVQLGNVEDEVDQVYKPKVDDDVITTSDPLLTNQLLAHELVLNPEFKLKRENQDPVQEKVAKVARQALVDVVNEEVGRGEYNRVIALMSEIGKDLQDIVDSEAVKNEISSVYDVDLITSQISHGVFQVENLFTYTIEKMKALCAHVRDQAVRDLSMESDLGKKVVGIKELLVDMKLDFANFKLTTLKPTLARQAVTYEQAQFQKRLDDGLVKLDLTTEWLKKASDELLGIIESRNPENVTVNVKPKFDDIYTHAFLSLLFSPVENTLPETFGYDGKRLFDFQNQIQECTVTCALVMLSRNIVREFRDDQVQSRLVKEVFAVLRAPDVGMDKLVQVITELGDEIRHQQAITLANLSTLTSTTKPVELRQVTDEEKDMIKNMVIKTLSAKDPFYSLISRRIEKAIKTALSKDVQPELKNSGVECISSEFEKLFTDISSLYKFNRDVYGGYYTSILKSILQ